MTSLLWRIVIDFSALWMSSIHQNIHSDSFHLEAMNAVNNNIFKDLLGHYHYVK